MKPSIIVHGKNDLSPEELDKLAEFYGFKKWSVTALQTVEPRKRNGWLILNISKVEFESDLELIHLVSAVHDYNSAIPLTDWKHGPPPTAGEWIASAGKSNVRRFWNGISWSAFFEEFDHQEYKNNRAAIISKWTTSLISWRGLSKPPIILKESK